MSSDPQQPITASAREKLQDVWTSLRSINTEDMESRVASLAKWTPWSTNDSAERGNPLESMMRTMFSSCTNGDDTTAPEISPSSKRSSKQRSTPCSEDHARAKYALHSLREKAEQRETSPSKRKSSIPKPFPMSSPQRKTSREAPSMPYLVQEVGPATRSHSIPDLSGRDATFDDGISAISAHTLEELERQNQLKNPHHLTTVRSDLTQDEALETINSIMSKGSSTLFPGMEEDERDCYGASMSPFDLHKRGRSNNSWGSKGGRNRSFQTMSTQSTDFEKMFHQDEQEYWEDTVQEDEKGSPTVRKGTVRQIHMLMKERYRSRSGDDSVSLYRGNSFPFSIALCSLSPFLLVLRTCLRSSKTELSPLQAPLSFPG